MDEAARLGGLRLAQVLAGGQRGLPALGLHEDHRAQLDHRRVVLGVFRERRQFGNGVVEHSELGIALRGQERPFVSFEHQASSDSSSSTRRAKSWSVASTGAGLDISTPAFCKVGIGNSEPPDFKNPR